MKNLPNLILVAKRIENEAPYNGRVYITIDDDNVLIQFEFVSDIVTNEGGYEMELELNLAFSITEIESSVIPEDMLVQGFLTRLKNFVELMKERSKKEKE